MTLLICLHVILLLHIGIIDIFSLLIFFYNEYILFSNDIIIFFNVEYVALAQWWKPIAESPCKLARLPKPRLQG